MSEISRLITGLTILALLPALSDASEALFRIDGQAQETLFGAAVAPLGDIDGDGVPDFAVGAPLTLGPGGGGYLDGQVLVYSGASKALLYKLNPLRHRGFFGGRLSRAKDLDADGVPDLLVGAPWTPSEEFYGVGSVLAFSGATGKLIFEFLGEEGGTYMGSAVDAIGDLDKDGVPEIVIGTPYGTGGGPYGGGVVSVLSGSNGSLLYEFDGDDSGDYLGEAVAGLGDVDGDGVPDLLLGAPNASPGGLSQAGLVQLRSGATGRILLQLEGTEVRAFFGQVLANVHDVDGDGVDDFAIGAPSASPGEIQDAGSVYVYSGATAELLYRWDGTSRFDAFGSAIGGGDDVDGDGVPDIVVGAPGASPSGVRGAGSAFVFSGATGELLLRLDGQELDASFGASVAIAGDLDGDGRAEVLVGAPYAGPGGQRGAGSVFAFGF